MTRRYETGSVVGFVLVGILLTALLVGGIWLARHPFGSSDQTATEPATTMPSDPGNDDATSPANTKNKEATTDEELKNTLSQQSSNSSPKTTPASSTPSGSLPATGPADVVLEMVGATLLAGTAVAYARSRSIA